MKKIPLFLFGLLLLFSFSSNVSALSFPKTIDKFAADNNVNVNENIAGDLYVAGNNVTVNGTIAGDVIGAGNTINITGDISHSVRVAGNNINLSNVSANNITVAGNNILLMNINANRVYAAGALVEFTGTANNINLSGAEVILSGTINGISTIEAEKVTIKDTAVINDKLTVKATKDIIYDANVIKDNITYIKVDHQIKKESFNLGSKIFWFMWKIITMSLMALVIMALFNNFIEKAIKNIKDKKVSTILFGLLLFIAIPILSILAMITMIGIPIAIITIFGYITTLIVASTFSAITLGNILFADKNKYLRILMGILIISILSSIPIICFFVWLTCVGYTFGSISLLFKK